MSYQVTCVACNNEYLLQKKPEPGTMIKCCICHKIWQIRADDIIELHNPAEDQIQAKHHSRWKAFIILLGLFITGYALWHVTYMQDSFMVISTQMIEKNEDKYITCNILNRTNKKKCIKSVKVNFEKESIEYKIKQDVNANQIYAFEARVYPENALTPTVEVTE